MTAKLYFDDLRVGDRWVTEARELVPPDIRSFASLTGDWNPIHLDPEYAQQTPFRRPIAHGLLALAVSAGLGSLAPELHEVVLLSIDHWRFCQPVYPGDRLYLVNEVTAIDSNSRKRGHVTWLRQLYNQEHQLVQSGTFETLVAKRTGPRDRLVTDTSSLEGVNRRIGGLREIGVADE